MKRFIFATIFVFFSPLLVFAGTIDTTNKYARFLSTGTLVNFGTTNGSVVVNDYTITGHAWSTDLGWINLAPTNGGVVNNGEGVLSGYAWGEGTGWVNFNPTNGGVTIDSTGNFNGYAWSQAKGWIVFNCATDSSCGTLSHKVQTNWIPISARVQCNDLIDNDSDGLVDYPSDPGCSSSVDTDETNASGGGGGMYTPPALPPPSEPTPTPAPPPPAPEPIPAPVPPPPSEPTLTPGPTAPTPESSPLPSATPSVGSSVGGGGGVVENFFAGGSIPAKISEIVTNITDAVSSSAVAIKENIVELTVQTQKVVSEVRKEAKVIIETPAGKATSQTITTVGVVTGGTTSLFPLIFTQVFSLRDILFLPAQIWGLLLSAFGIRRRHRPWGAVYDSVTKQPLDPAYVELQTLDGKEVATAFTDLDGRYGFLVPPGEYRVVANKTNYKFPSERLRGKEEDEFYGNLYFGGTINLLEGEAFIARDIPMDPEGFDWNEYAKRAKHLIGFYSRNMILIERASRLLFLIGFALTLFVLFVDMNIFSITICVLYVVVWGLRKVGPGDRPRGVVIEKGTGNPLAFGVVKVIQPDTKVEVRKSITDALGRYYCLVAKGEYDVDILRKQLDGNYASTGFSKEVKARNGIIQEKFEI